MARKERNGKVASERQLVGELVVVEKRKRLTAALNWQTLNSGLSDRQTD